MFSVVDVCDTNYCEHGGTCLINEVTGEPGCVCAKYYIGDHCQERYTGQFKGKYETQLLMDFSNQEKIFSDGYYVQYSWSYYMY